MSAAPPGPPPRRDRRRHIAAALLGGVAALFAALNLDEVDFNWILGTCSTRNATSDPVPAPRTNDTTIEVGVLAAVRTVNLLHRACRA